MEATTEMNGGIENIAKDTRLEKEIADAGAPAARGSGFRPRRHSLLCHGFGRTWFSPSGHERDLRLSLWRLQRQIRAARRAAPGTGFRSVAGTREYLHASTLGGEQS